MGIHPTALYEAVLKDVSHLAEPDFSVRRCGFIPVKNFAASYLLSSVIRKWIPKDSRLADGEARNAFISANSRCLGWKWRPERLVDDYLLGETRKIIDNFLHPFGDPLIQTRFDLLRSMRPGPGVNVGSTGTSFYSKYCASTLTTTSLSLYEEYKSYSTWIPFLSEAESIRYEKFGLPSVVSGSRCSFVPKTEATSRMICVEPSLNMLFQLGLAHLLEERLRSFFRIDLSTQPLVNHQLARLGSVDGDFVTIDLSSASDSISLGLCELLFPKWFFELLLSLRSHTTEIDGNRVPLYMMSTMGNGFTFPLQTLIFSSILQAAINLDGGSHASGDWSCFGDDLICRKRVFPKVSRLLSLFGFTMNERKTFFEGQFRESCGADWFCGQPVRPVFVRKLDLPFDIFVAINQLNKWSSVTGIPLRNTISFLVSSLGRKFLTYVPLDSSEDEGIQVPLKYLRRRRYDGNRAFLFRSWARRPAIVRVLDGEIRIPGRKRGWLFNPPGLYASFLFGELVSYKIMVRHDLRSYRYKLRCCPYWDGIPRYEFSEGRMKPRSSVYNGTTLDWTRWETTALLNLPSLEEPQPEMADRG